MEYAYQRQLTGERRLHRSEMRQKPNLRDTFFGLKSEPQNRPSSVATEFVDTDWDEEILSEAEDSSPRHSVGSDSGGQQSITTVSTYDEVTTPRSSQGRFPFAARSSKAVEGPMGPHLFRSSASSHHVDDEAVLTLSPITPKTARPPFGNDGSNGFAMMHETEPVPTLPMARPPRRKSSPSRFTRERLDTSDLVSWTPEMVAQSMLDAGMEHSVAERFVENDINGPILITLKFEDLKELSIQSFGIRTKVWSQIQALRDSRPSSPRAPTPIQDEPSREVKREHRRREDSGDCGGSGGGGCGGGGGGGLQRRKSSRRRLKNPSHEDIISPLESVSIVGIEQVIPKPHQCSKGENCSKFRKQQRLIEKFKKEHPHADMENGTVMISGDPGNPLTARAIDPNESLRPTSDAVPSVVASSDVLGPGGIPTLQYLQEATLRGLESRDPQDNVRQFLNFQQHASNDVPPTPPFEMLPAAMRSPKEGLSALPKLSIPGKQPEQPAIHRASTTPQSAQPAQSQARESSFAPYRMDRAEALSPDLQTPTNNPYRFGTPFSEMDVPVTAVPLDRIERNASQSVPPEMNYHHPVSTQSHTRSQSRTSARRPSFPVMPALDENTATPVVRTHNKAISPERGSVRPQPYQQQQKPLQAPPRGNYPWSPAPETRSFEQAIPPNVPVHDVIAAVSSSSASASSSTLSGGGSSEGPAASMDTNLTGVSTHASGGLDPATNGGITYQGPMKKRKTRMLRHEWQDGYFTLKGTRLAMHKHALDMDRTLEYVDIDDYAIACSSLASQSKLSAAFKRVHLTSGSSWGSKDSNTDSSNNNNVGAFAFQLIPQGKDGGVATAKLRKRESGMSFAGSMGLGGGGGLGAAGLLHSTGEGVNGTGKTHRFAVKNKDERIDWMRELMLAKALRQKGEGFEVRRNGNMI